jgi:hypothetical protein
MLKSVPSKFGCWLYPIKAVTGTTYTVTPEDFGKLITNRGAAGALAVTLPDPATVPVGSWVKFYSVVDQDFSVGRNEVTVGLNSAAADSVGWTTNGEQIGNGCMAVNLGTLWFIEMAVADEANTMTITVD